MTDTAKTLLAATVVALAPSSAGAAEAWPAAPGEVQVSAEGSLTSATKQYQDSGGTFRLLDEQSNGAFRAQGLALRTEFGLLPDVAVSFDISAMSARVTSAFAIARVTGVSDAALGAKWAVVDDGFVLTPYGRAKFPTGYTADAGPYMPALGNGVGEYELGLRFGKRFVDAPFYFEVASAYRLRGARTPRGGGPRLDYADEVPYLAEFGFSFGESVGIVAALDGVFGLGSPATIDALTLYPVTEDYIRVAAELRYQAFDRFSLFGGYGITVSGINSLAAQNLVVGVEYRAGVADD